MQLYAISRRMLYGSLVFVELCADKVDGRYRLSIIVFITCVLVKFSFWRYLSSCKSSISFFLPYSSSQISKLSALLSVVWSVRTSNHVCYDKKILLGKWSWGNWCNCEVSDRGYTIRSRKLWFLKEKQTWIR